MSRLVRALIDTASEVLVMTPVLISRLQWLKRGLLDQIRELGIPITVFELDRAGQPPLRA